MSYVAPSYASGSPAGSQYSQPYAASAVPQIQPGQIVYTMGTDAQGRPIYYPFRAEPASYQTSAGVVSGIQWKPLDGTPIPPPNSQPAGPDFAASWNRSYAGNDRGNDRDDRTFREWQKEEEKRRRKDEKEAAKRNAMWEKERLARERAEEKELRKARERDTGRVREVDYVRERRLSNAGYPLPGSGGIGDLDRQFDNMGIGGRERRVSMNYGNNAPYAAPAYGAPGAGFPAPGYPPPSPRGDGFPRPGGSPYARTSPLPGGGVGGVSVYPPGHVLEGQPIPGPGSQVLRGHSPRPSPYGSDIGNFPPGMNPSPRMGGSRPLGYGPDQRYPQPGQGLLQTPEAFARPVNRTAAFVPFELTKVVDLNDLARMFPPLPPAVASHDVMPEDWNRLMNDLFLAWTGKMPLPGRPIPKKSSVAADLVDLWNNAFFKLRNIEVVLFKGRECRSGKYAGRSEMRLPRFEDSSDYSLTSSSSEASLSDPDEWSRYGHYNGYGRNDNSDRWAAEMREARRYRREHRAEKMRRARERKMRRKERERTYTLYVRSLTHRDISSGAYGM